MATAIRELRAKPDVSMESLFARSGLVLEDGKEATVGRFLFRWRRLLHHCGIDAQRSVRCRAENTNGRKSIPEDYPLEEAAKACGLARTHFLKKQRDGGHEALDGDAVSKTGHWFDGNGRKRDLYDHNQIEKIREFNKQSPEITECTRFDKVRIVIGGSRIPVDRIRGWAHRGMIWDGLPFESVNEYGRKIRLRRDGTSAAYRGPRLFVLNKHIRNAQKAIRSLELILQR